MSSTRKDAVSAREERLLSLLLLLLFSCACSCEVITTASCWTSALRLWGWDAEAEAEAVRALVMSWGQREVDIGRRRLGAGNGADSEIARFVGTEE